MGVAGQLYALQTELRQYEAARNTLERCAALGVASK
jgi:hypothetical protein